MRIILAFFLKQRSVEFVLVTCCTKMPKELKPQLSPFCSILCTVFKSGCTVFIETVHFTFLARNYGVTFKVEEGDAEG